MLEPVDIVRQCLDAFKRGDVPFFLAHVADDCQWSGSTSPDIPYTGQFTGPKGVTKFFDAIGGNLDIKVFDVERYVADGEHVVASGFRHAGANGRVNNSGRYCIDPHGCQLEG